MQLGDFADNATIVISFTTHASTGELVAPSAAFVAADFRVYKNGSATEKTSANGITVVSPFDSVMGKHVVTIDTNNDTGDAGFWAAGNDYRVEINSAKTVDGHLQTGVEIGSFSLENRYMRGTAGANTVVPPTATENASTLLERQVLAGVSYLEHFTSLSTDVPTVAQFEARTLPSADYFVVGDYTAPANASIATILVDTETTIPGLIDTLRGADSDTLKTLSDQIDGISGGAGTGARTVTITVTDGTDPLQNATVRMSEGANTYTALTNASGVATFNLDDATYTVGVSKSGYTFAGTTLVVDGAEVVTYSMTQVVVSPPDDATASTGVAIVYDENEQPEASVPVYFRKYVTGGPGTAGYVEDYAIKTLMSDGSGNIEGEFRRLWTYEVWRGDGSIKRRFTVPDASSFSIAEVLGADI